VGDGVGADEEEEVGDSFETRAIFTLADFFKVLEPNECYDIAQKMFLKWDEQYSEMGQCRKKLEKIVRIGAKTDKMNMEVAFSRWKTMRKMFGLVE
jgi:hypothetical protein